MQRNLYTIRQLDQNIYRIVKFDDDLNVRAIYLMACSGTREMCNCPTSRRTYCKHHNILATFRRLDRIDSGWFYDYDHREWYPPLSNGGLNVA